MTRAKKSARGLPSGAVERGCRAIKARLRHFGIDHSGSVAIITALMLPVLIGFLAIGSEVGYWYMTERKLQQIADVAAHAGATELKKGGSQTQILDAARLAVSQSWGDRAVVTTVANKPPLSGSYQNSNQHVEVLLDISLPRYLSAIYDTTPVALSARAVAGSGAGYRACMLAVSENGGGRITVSGSANVVLDGCSMASNSTASNSFEMQGSATSISAGCIDSAGGVVTTSQLALSDCVQPREQQAPVPNPYLDRADPLVTGTCRPDSSNLGDRSRVTPTEIHPTGVPFARICGGTRLSGTVTFDSGLYIIDGGVLNISNYAVMKGSGVAFFLTNGATLSVAGTSRLELTAMSTGPFAGFLFFSKQSGDAVTHTFRGTANSRLNGVLYFPGGTLDYAGNFTSDDPCLQIIAGTINITGNSTLRLSCDATASLPILVNQRVVLLE
jgi:hypothetical protein